MTSPSTSHFGDLLRSYRRAAGLTQKELADLTGLSVRDIRTLERGTSRAISQETALTLANALGLNPTERERLLAARERMASLAKPAPREEARASAAQPGQLTLIGRAHERSQIERLLARDGPPMLLFYGKPGIGKTRLLQDAAEQAQRSGWTVLRGGSQQPAGQHPYAPLVQALEGSFVGQSLAQRRKSLRGSEWMARLLPEVVGSASVPTTPWQMAPDQERRLMFSAVARYIARLADPNGVLLVLDDLQWAAPDGLSLLVALIHSAVGPARPTRLRVVAAARDTELDASHPLSGTLADLARDRLVSRIRVGPLALEHAHMLLQAALAGAEGDASDEREAAARMVLARAGGTPFFLMSFARELSTRRGGNHQTFAANDIPWDITAMVRQWVNLLPPAGRDVLAVAAVHGRETPLTLLASACDFTERQVIEAVEAAYAVGLLEEAHGSACKFVHDLTREAVLASLSAARVQLLHQRVAEALEADPRRAQAEPLAFHYSRSAESDLAIRYLERAGDQAWALRAYTAAEACYRDALGRLAAQGATSDCARVHEKLGELLMGCGRYADAARALEDAVSCFGQVGNADAAGRAVAQIGWAHVRGGSGDRGLARVEPQLEPGALADLRPSTQVRLWCAHAVLLFGQNRYLEQLASARRATALAQEADDTVALARSLRMEGLALVQLGQLREALPVMQETIRIAEMVGDLDSFSAALNDSAAAYRALGDLTSSVSHSARAVEVAEILGDPTGAAFFATSHGNNAFLLGDWAMARKSYERAIAIVRDLGSLWVTAYPLISLGALNLAEGDNDAGARLLAEAVALAERCNDLQALRIGQAAQAERELLRGAAADALQRLQPLLDTTTSDEKDTVALLPLVGWANLDLGELAHAEAALNLCLRRAGATGARLVIVDALIAQARLRIRQADWAQARESLDHVLALSKEMAYPYAEVKARYIYGELCAASHLPTQAYEQYMQALALCQRLGESLYRSRIERALTNLNGA